MSEIDTEPVVMSPEVRTFHRTASRVAPAAAAVPVAVAVDPVRTVQPSAPGLVPRPSFAVSMQRTATSPAAQPVGRAQVVAAVAEAIADDTPVRTIAIA